VVLAGYWSAALQSDDPSVYVPVGTATYDISMADSARNFENGLTALVRKLNMAGKAVLVFKDVPMFTFDPVDRVKLLYMPARMAAADALKHGLERDLILDLRAPKSELRKDSSATIVEIAVANLDVTLVDPRSVLCDVETCAYGASGSLYYTDGQHLSAVGAAKVMTNAAWAIAGLPGGDPAVASIP
jgi:SGNH domain (fused to AT3 domains)